MSLLTNHALKKEDKSNTINISIIARAEKIKNPKVINATIGMLYDENNKFFVFNSANKALGMLTSEEKFAYPSIEGSCDYHNALKKWIFRQYEKEILSNMYCSIIATPGGSGAIGNTFTNYLNENDAVLLPNYMWGNYKQFAYENNESYLTYKLFDELGNFNLKDIEYQINSLKSVQGRILLVINDPCHNPTGYCMKKEEWEELINIINKYSIDGTPFVLLYDMAYIDYDYRGFDATRENIRLFQKLNDNVLVVLAFSGSKTIGLYGMRVGAQIGLSKSKNNIIDFEKANKYSARSKWSTTSITGMNIITKAFLDEELVKDFTKEVEMARKLLVDRAKTFIEAADKVGLKTLPFNCGFFVSVPCENPMKIYEKLALKDVYVIPLTTSLRVAISAINLNECKRLPLLIKEEIDLQGKNW